jgi:hypothetical protein
MNNPISLIVAYKPDTIERIKNLVHFKLYYSNLLPFGEIIVVESENDVFEKCKLYNEGFSRAKYDTVCFIDSDIFVSESALQTAYDYAQNPDNVVLGYSGNAIYMTYKFKNELKTAFTYDDLIKPIRPYDQLVLNEKTDDYLVGNLNAVGGCLMMHRKAFEDINGFNPNFKNWGYEDDEIVKRAHILKKNVIKLKRSQQNMLIHLPHLIANPDRSKHEFYEHNHKVASALGRMNFEQASEYIKTWEIDAPRKELIDVDIDDTNFVGYDPSCCRFQRPTHFNWDGSRNSNSKSLFFTDNTLRNAKIQTEQLKVAWILEPRAVAPHVYSYIEQNYKDFNYVLTYDKQLLSLDKRFLIYPYGTSWVHNFTDEKQLTKEKHISIIASTKNTTVGHRLRHEVIQKFDMLNHPYIDVFGSGYNKIVNKKDALEKYEFSIVIENSIQDTYFTEKLIDCFATKTVPIYYGTPDVNHYFNKNGILFFSTVDELETILQTLTNHSYDGMKYAIEDNYKRYQDFIIPEDYIYENYKFLFDDE